MHFCLYIDIDMFKDMISKRRAYMSESIKLPIGIENFEEIRRMGYYYVDKTKYIEQFLDNRGKVNLITRPRRFGKTLNMSMLKYFFEIGTDTSLFDGLYILQIINHYVISIWVNIQLSFLH